MASNELVSSLVSEYWSSTVEAGVFPLFSELISSPLAGEFDILCYEKQIYFLPVNLGAPVGDEVKLVKY